MSNEIIETVYIDEWTAPARKVKKLIDVNGEWKEKIFYRVYGDYEMRKWCEEHHGPPIYMGKWMQAGNYVLMEEHVFTHWMLCK